MKYRLTKLSDDKFNGNHPNGIFEGYIKEGNNIYPEKPTAGEPFYLDTMHTSRVIEEMDDNGVFKTKNSTYRLEVLQSDNSIDEKLGKGRYYR